MVKTSFKANEPCLCCGENRDGYVTYHHQYTRGAYPNLIYEKKNMMPLCKDAHVKIHKMGAVYMANKHPKIFKWFLDNEWEYDSFSDKWTNSYLTNLNN